MTAINKDSQRFGTLLRAARVEAGLGANELGEKIDMGRGFMWSLERGECSIQPDKLDALCQVLPKLESHKELAPKASRVWKIKPLNRLPPALRARANGHAKPVVQVHTAPALEDMRQFYRTMKQLGPERVRELCDIIEVVQSA